MNRTIQNPKRVSIIVDSEALKEVNEILKLSGTSFSFFVRHEMGKFAKYYKGMHPMHRDYFSAYDLWPGQYGKIAPRGKGGKNVQENEK